jgi:hypothetical protein
VPKKRHLEESQPRNGDQYSEKSCHEQDKKKLLFKLRLPTKSKTKEVPIKMPKPRYAVVNIAIDILNSIQ